MILDIIHYPDPRLKRICEPVRKITPCIRELAANMLETMYASHGVGLAAPQVGENIRMLVMDPGQNGEPDQPRVIINPELEFLGEKIISEKEGCLSVPLNYRCDVPRYSRIGLKGMNEKGELITEVLSDFPAIVVQHETDHLDGKLFIDRISHLRRALYDSKVKKWMKNKGAE